MNIDKSELHKMGINARAYYEKEFDREYLLESLESIFES